MTGEREQTDAQSADSVSHSAPALQQLLQEAAELADADACALALVQRPSHPRLRCTTASCDCGGWKNGDLHAAVRSLDAMMAPTHRRHHIHGIVVKYRHQIHCLTSSKHSQPNNRPIK